MQCFLLKIISTFFYVGFVPLMPGTVATLLSLLIAWFLPDSGVLLSCGSIVLFLLGTALTGHYAAMLTEKDPGQIVIDEVSGVWLGLGLLQCLLHKFPHIFHFHLSYIDQSLICKKLTLFILVFLCFRFFDISKPSIVGLIDRKISGGLGIMLDDIAAGILTFIVLAALLFVLSII